MTRGVNIDVVHHPELSAMHALVTKYDRKTEILYSALQILTASFASFAHGSNDIANAVGPLSTIYAIYDSNWQSTPLCQHRHPHLDRAGVHHRPGHRPPHLRLQHHERARQQDHLPLTCDEDSAWSSLRASLC